MNITKTSLPLRFLLLGLCASFSVPATAQNVFVSLATRPKQALSQTIPPPGFGWNYSAAAPVPGETWNFIRRPEPIDITDASVLTGGRPGTGHRGLFPLGNPEGTVLVDSTNQPTSWRLLITLKVENLSTDKARAEPSFYTKSKGAIPAGLMDFAWRIFHGENSLAFTLSGLKPGKAYDLYIYAATFDAGSSGNPTGEGSGARFTLSDANAIPGKSNNIETTGGYLASLYTFEPETNKISLAPEGTTWAKLYAQADADGRITFNTRANSRKQQMINGFQLIDSAP